MRPEDFPLLMKDARRPERTAEAILAIAEGCERGEIRNTTFKDSKSVLGQAVQEGWDRHIATPFFYAGRWEQQPNDVARLYSDCAVYSLHDVLALNRKLDRTEVTGPVVEAMRAYAREVLPLAQAAADLKHKVVKGRAPRQETREPENPGKVSRSCACCFRRIAVTDSVRMAHHGYQRPGDGQQTASCPGIQFPPLEVSSRGLEHILHMNREALRRCTATYEKRDSWTRLYLTRGRKLVEITPEMPEWPQAKRSSIARLQQQIHYLEKEVSKLEALLENWKPQETAEEILALKEAARDDAPPAPGL